MRDESGVDAILEGTYDFLEECPPEAKKICRQAGLLHQKVTEESIQIVTRKRVFQQWWLKAREDT